MSETQSPRSRIARRTRGQSHGPITRLMSPFDFGRVLKPFVFLDLFDTQDKPFTGFGLHPHSGIATLTYVAEGRVSYEDTNGATGWLRAGGLEWVRTGGRVWHGGGAGEPGRTRGFQLWVALSPDLEVGPSESVYAGTGAYFRRWAGACPPRKLRNRDKCDQSPVTDELPRRAF
jgi:redox-sensitive bicupin YhaK (pirin superfamily)